VPDQSGVSLRRVLASFGAGAIGAALVLDADSTARHALA
jgi:hypothetical protein